MLRLKPEKGEELNLFYDTATHRETVDLNDIYQDVQNIKINFAIHHLRMCLVDGADENAIDNRIMVLKERKELLKKESTNGTS